jgi:hypothetical protein
MKRSLLTTAVTLLLLILPALSQPSSATTADSGWQESYDKLLRKYVTTEGVRYRDWHADTADLKALRSIVDAIARADLSKTDSRNRLAFYLDAYNAWILHNILEDYPTKGPGGGGIIGRSAFFKWKSIRVAGAQLSFEKLENQIIRRQFDEPRIHFALNCASISCPPLHNRAFSCSDLDQILEDLTSAFINTNPLGIQEKGTGKIFVSKIFDWYEDDFLGRGSVLEFINAYRQIPFAKQTRIGYMDYLWTLNEAE